MLYEVSVHDFEIFHGLYTAHIATYLAYSNLYFCNLENTFPNVYLVHGYGHTQKSIS